MITGVASGSHKREWMERMAFDRAKAWLEKYGLKAEETVPLHKPF